MDLKEFAKIIKNNTPTLALFAVIGSLVAFSITTKIKSSVELEQLFYIETTYEAPQAEYRFDGYYAQEKARNFTDTAVAILSSSGFVGELNTEGTITVRKMAPQVIRLNVQSSSSQAANQKLTEAVLRFNQKMLVLQKENPHQLKAISLSPKSVFSGPTKKISAVLGFFLGGIFALLVVGLKVYFKV